MYDDTGSFTFDSRHSRADIDGGIDAEPEAGLLGHPPARRAPIGRGPAGGLAAKLVDAVLPENRFVTILVVGTVAIIFIVLFVNR